MVIDICAVLMVIISQWYNWLNRDAHEVVTELFMVVFVCLLPVRMSAAVWPRKRKSAQVCLSSHKLTSQCLFVPPGWCVHSSSSFIFRDKVFFHILSS